MLGRRAAGGSTGMAVVRVLSAGLSSRSIAEMKSAILPIALMPRNGMLPCAIAAQRGDFEPIHAAMSQADAVDVERLGDDHEVGAIAADIAVFSQIRHARESAALFVDGSALLHGAGQIDARAPDRFDAIDRRGDTGFLIGDAAAE